jgi:predicted CopG family antitoxin
MPFKTISVDLEAYGALKDAKQSKRESFSSVIKRSIVAPPAANFAVLLKQLEEFAGRGVFTPKGRAELRKKQRHPLRSRTRAKPLNHAS